MKRIILCLLMTITLQQSAYTQSNWPLYWAPGSSVPPLSYTRDQALLPNGKVAMINTSIINAGSSSSQFFVVGTPDSETIAPVVVSGIDFSDPTPSWNYFVDQAPGNKIIMTGFARMSSGAKALLSYYNPATNIVTPESKFILTGNTNVKFNGNGIGSDSLRLCLEDNISTTVNGITIPAYGIIDLCLATGAVVLRNDLILYGENGKPQPTFDVLLLSNGKRVHCGGGIKRSSPAGPSAQHGLIEDPLTGLITNLGFPGSGLIACKRMVEKNGYIYIAHEFLDQPGITNVFMKKNISTGLISEIPIYPIYSLYIRMSKVSDMIVTLEGMIVIVGSPLSSGASTFAIRHNPYIGTTEDLDIGIVIFSHPDEVSNINSVVSYPSIYWGQTLSLTGNFEFGTTGGTASFATHTANIITDGLPPLPIKLISFTSKQVGNNSLLSWDIAEASDGIKYQLERSNNGMNFISINLQLGNGTKKSFSYTDQISFGGNIYYRLRMIDIDGKVTYSPILLLKTTGTENKIIIYPNPVPRGSNLQVTVNGSPLKSYTLVNNQGQAVTRKENLSIVGATTISLPILPTGNYYLRMVTENSARTEKVVIQ